MASTTAVLILCISAVVIYGGLVDSAHQNKSPAPAADCTTVILSMVDCLSYVTAGSTVKKPEGTCCVGLKSVLKTDEQCLCEAFKNSAQMGVALNITKAIALPSACHVYAPPVSSCIGTSNGTGTAPVQAPMAMGEAPTMAVPPGPAGAVAPAPVLGSTNSAGRGLATGSVFLSMLLAVYFY